MTSKLKGIAWDHPRGYEPLKKLSEKFTEQISNVSVEWEIRSLKKFGDMPIEDLIGEYDLITIDHPYIGQAHENGLLCDLKDMLSQEVLSELKNQSLGKCYPIYWYANNLYALPIDAAALVAAYRKDLIKAFDLTIPKNWEELRALHQSLPSGHSMAWALCPTDIWCTFLTLCAQFGGRDFIENHQINKEVGIKALDELCYHLPYLHPKSLEWNPIQILDQMGNSDEIIYSPYLFGYSNYAREGYKKNIIHFTNSPKHPQNNISTIMGGVGLAVSAQSESPELAAELSSFIAGTENQIGPYTKYAGQPACRAAWTDIQNNKLCNNFFSDTITTIEDAYIRPQHPNWNTFQEHGADLLHQGLMNSTTSEQMVKQLNELYSDTMNS